jgi:hypothetical protein
MSTRERTGVAPLILLALLASGCTYRKQWQQEVPLADGRVITVGRMESVPEDYPLRGPKRGADTATFTIPLAGGGSAVWPARFGDVDAPAKAVIIDERDGAPLVVAEVKGEVACKHFGLPREGHAAFRYVGERWQRVPFKDLPPTLTANVPWRLALTRPGELQDRIPAEAVRNSFRIANGERRPPPSLSILVDEARFDPLYCHF